MIVKELRLRIRDLIESVPEESLEEIYKYLQEVKDIPTAKIKHSRSLSRIINEDRELLKRLAQ